MVIMDGSDHLFGNSRMRNGAAGTAAAADFAGGFAEGGHGR
jgi:hypothetical protein